LADFSAVDSTWFAGEGRWETLLRIRSEAAKALEQARAVKLIGAALDAHVTLHVTDPELAALVTQAGERLLRELHIVSQLVIRTDAPAAEAVTGPDRVVLRETGIPGLGVVVRRADGQKCGRCWTWSPAVGQAPEHPALCERCVPVIRAGAGR